MNEAAVPASSSPLARELRWLITLRWVAGSTVAAGILVNAAWVGFSAFHTRILITGLTILAYNLVFRLGFRTWVGSSAPRHRVVAFAIVQLLLDLLCLTLLTVWTGGISSPLIGLYVLHMVFASLLLPRLVSYLGAPVAIGMLAIGLLATDQWPTDHPTVVLAAGWMLTLFLTVYLANHITGTLRDRETALRRHHRRTRSILDTAAEGIITVDGDGVIDSVNPAAERMFGMRAPDLVGRPFTALIPELESDAPARAIERLLVRPEAAVNRREQMHARHEDGSVFPVELAFTAVPLGERRAYTGVVRDISEHKRAQAELRALNEELRRQQAALVQHEKLTAMGQMAAGVAHEISNPLANMDSILQLLDRHPERLDDLSLEKLREQVARIRRTIHQMRYFAHPDDECWETASINEIVEQSLEMVRFDHRIRSVEVVRELAAEPDRVRLMPHALQQVMVNLVLNALDAVQGVDGARLIVRTRAANGVNTIEVEDNGRGIEPGDLDRIFEPFFTTKPVGQGTGLGLSISYSLVERHGGTIAVDSTLGSGTRFSIDLPKSPA
jgi:PAS domain S-box-containing protein